MRRVGDMNAIVHVEPLWMVVVGIGHGRKRRHEAERRLEVWKEKGAFNRVAASNLAPLGLGQISERFASLLRRQL